jgi:outer membrane protein assembly factor BamB
MANFEQLAIGGVDYYSESEPTGAKSEELWLQYDKTTEKTSDTTSATSVGSLIWEFNMDNENVTSITVGENKIYITGNPATSSTKNVRAVDFDGNEIWTHNLHNYWASDATYKDGIVYTGGRDGELVAADGLDGSEIWYSQLSNYDVDGISVSDNGVFSAGTNVHKSDLKDGSEIWTHTHHSDIPYKAHYHNGIVFSGDSGGNIIAADASDGSKLWETNISTANIIYTINATDEYVVCGNYDKEIYKLDINSGDVLWEKTMMSDNALDILISDGVIVSISGYNDTTFDNVVFSNLSDGSIRFSQSFNTSGNGLSSGELYSNKIFLGTYDDRLEYRELDGISDSDITETILDVTNGDLHINYNGTWTPHQ